VYVRKSTAQVKIPRNDGIPTIFNTFDTDVAAIPSPDNRRHVVRHRGTFNEAKTNRTVFFRFFFGSYLFGRYRTASITGPHSVVCVCVCTSLPLPSIPAVVSSYRDYGRPVNDRRNIERFFRIRWKGGILLFARDTLVVQFSSSIWYSNVHEIPVIYIYSITTETLGGREINDNTIFVARLCKRRNRTK